ncbi:hypothetical protein M2444_003603 [Paenibacillus sp. PastF-3]|uniref:hypothetical protein n=1 Tax=unclassified Paenibacillus TaxID=185978 RepID=UPI002474183E|nr:hypothetical protein [Paenibacillus sp. PastF-3]MDH6371804.1 hypothetical protein [Paenibacillus sp. PastF-3]
MNKKRSDLDVILQNCLDRGCTRRQLQDFIDRARIYNNDRLNVLALIDDLEVRYITSFDLLEGVEV